MLEKDFLNRDEARGDRPSRSKRAPSLEKVLTILRSRGLEGIAEPCLQFRTLPMADGEPIPGSSKLGGDPELPEEYNWPIWHGKPLDFLLQLDCGEIPAHLKDALLPETGWLYFFYDIERSTWGYDPRDRGSWRALFFSGDRKALLKKRRPDSGDAKLKACRLTFYEGIYLNWWLIDDDPFRHEDLLHAMEEISGHQILGHTEGVQHSYEEMQRKCQFVSHGIYMGGSGGPPFDKAKAKLLEPGIEDWRLLLELGSDENSGLFWSHYGKLYFWIRDQDLRERDFDHVWGIFECL
jgi:uncharacterized protein YwqG